MEPSKDQLPEENQIKDNKPRKDRMVFRGVQTVVGIAIFAATVLTLWNPRSVFKTPNIEDLFQSAMREDEMPESLEQPVTRIGILAGHWQDKPGNVCADGRTEQDLNYEIAYQLQVQLESQGYRVDLFPEFDERLFNYDASLLIAIYSGSCNETPSPPSGFRIGSSLTTENLELVNALALCLAEQYQAVTGLSFAYDVINPDHPSYHFFRDASPQTPVVRFEVGSMSTDEVLIFKNSGKVVQGISDGIECYLSYLEQGGFDG